MSDPADDFSDDPDIEKLLIELIGGQPGDGDPPSPFQTLQALLDAPTDVRHWGLRRLFQLDPAGAMDAVFGEYDLRESVGFIREYQRQQRTRRVREMLDSLDAGATPDPPELANLTSFLAEPDEEVRYRVEGLWPWEGRIVLAAQNKSGKTTLTGNLIRSLVDGDKFLDHFNVERVRRVVLIDNELSPSMVRRWLRDQGIVNTDAVDVMCLRGKLSSFNILDASCRAEWADRIGPADVLIFDCLRPALDALGLSEDKESGRFLEAVDELITAAGIPELLLVHHMGHSNERSRGDSRLEDWPDAKWKLVRQAEADDVSDERPPTFFSAFGRDVEQAEVRLAYDPVVRHLSVNGGSRKQATSGRIENAVQLFVIDNPGCSGGAIERGVEGDTNSIRNAIRNLGAGGWLRIVKQGAGKATLHWPEESPNVENS